MDGMAVIERLKFGVDTLHRSRVIHEIRNPNPNTKLIVVKFLHSMQGMVLIELLKFGVDTLHRSRFIHAIRNPNL